MDAFFQKPFESIDEDDINNLVEVRKVREYVGLDYKQTSYSHNHEGTVKLLADITAMANSRGGYLIVGVEEDKEAEDGTPKCIVGIEQGDVEANWIQNICITSIDEAIVGLRVRDIPLRNGKYCIVIQIPNSTKKPHMVAHEKHRSLRIRHGRSNAIIGMREVRDMILNMNSYQASLTSFLKERKDAVLNEFLGPFISLMATPIYIDMDQINPLEQDYRQLLEKAPGVPDGNYEGVYVGKAYPRIFGIEAVPPSRQQNGTYKKISRLFRNGHLEFCEHISPLQVEEWPQRPMAINSYRVTVLLLHFISLAQEVYSMAEMSDPIVFSLVLGRTEPSFLLPFRNRYNAPDYPFVWKAGLLSIDMTVTPDTDPRDVTSAMMDRFFNAFEYEKNLHFDENKELYQR